MNSLDTNIWIDCLSSQYLSVCLSVYLSIPPPPYLGEECCRQMLRSWCRSTVNLCDRVSGSLREKSGRRWGQRERKVTIGGGWLGPWRPQDPEDGEGSWGGWHLTRVKRPYLCFNKVTLTAMWREDSEGPRARTGRPIKETIAKSQSRNSFLVVSNRKSNSYLY